jgi:hypothetical protein
MSFFTGLQKTAEVFRMRATPKKHGGKSGRKIYTLNQDGKKWTCSCPDFVYRRQEDGSECKHIRAQKAGKKAWEMKKAAHGL